MFYANGVLVSNCGAHTTRWSGGDRVNLQNLPRGGAIRKAIAAPDGHLLAVVDASQTRDELYDFLNYHSYEEKLDQLFAAKK